MKKQTKRFLSILAALALLALALPPAASASILVTGGWGNLDWSISDTGVLTITGTGDMMDLEDFYNSAWLPFADMIQSVVIKDGITSIGANAFYDCYGVTSISIPASVKKIGKMAFENCFAITKYTVASGSSSFTAVGGVLFNKEKTRLIAYPVGNSATSYSIPSTVTVIGRRAFFSASNLKSITIPSGVKTISEEGFCYCNLLESVTLPSTVTTIGKKAFMCCWSLTAVQIPASVTSIGEGAFSCCSSMTSISVAGGNANYCVSGGVLFNKAKTLLIAYPHGKGATSYTIPSTVTKVGDGAFSEGSLTSITIPHGVKTIGDDAFSYCPIQKINIPSSITSIGDSAFAWCTDLTDITIPASVTSFGYNPFDGCEVVTVRVFPGSKAIACAKEYGIPYKTLKVMTLPKGTATIPSYAFAATGAEAVIIPEGCKTIQDYAFQDCPNLYYVSVPSTVTSIGTNAFKGCDKVYVDR